MSVLCDIQNNIATVTLNRPEVRNAFNANVIADLQRVFDKISADNTIRAVVLRGAGKVFCAGGDLNWMQESATYTFDQNKQDALNLARMLATLNSLPQPVICVAHGAAFGGGTGLVACSDVVLADKHTKFCFSEVKLGLIPATIGPFVVEAIGARQARRWFTTAEVFDAKTARKMGLVHDISDAPEEKLAEILENLLKNGPEAVKDAKRLVFDLQGQGLGDDVLEMSAERLANRRASNEGKEGISAFLEKRTANWVKEDVS